VFFAVGLTFAHLRTLPKALASQSTTLEAEDLPVMALAEQLCDFPL